ncbi:UDP-N-acetylmuramate--L-alanine ligase [Mucilaginibacter koreensis]
MELNMIKQVYLIGIGGIGMSGLARYFCHLGCAVFGYDKTSTPLTTELEQEGITITFDDEVAAIPAQFNQPNEETLVIYTPAIPKNSVILNAFQQRGFELYKRSQVLGIISKGSYTVAVAGTHGKTTTSCMIAYVLKSSGVDCSAFLGGIATNYQSNVLYGSSNVMVVEADEYDRSFLTLHPDVAIITSMDADHLDIYGDHSHLQESFRLFASQLKPEGKLIVMQGLQINGAHYYSANGQDAEAMAYNICVEDGDFYFDFKNNDISIRNIRMGIPGLHNIENAVAAIQAALYLGVDAEKIKDALGSFAGVKRRFEYIIKTEAHVFIDDYAHHPAELQACLASVKKLYPHRKLTVVFQPHLYTRTRDFAPGFAAALDMADELLLMDIYPARELPIEGISSETILSQMQLKDKYMMSRQEIVNRVSTARPELLLTVGAGDIDQMVEPLKQVLQNV